MFKQLHLKNFQAHADRSVVLGPITCIVGPTDAGKSAIFRGLRWVCTNNPSGIRFIRHGETDCEVTLVLDAGDRITRRRSKTENTYHVNGTELKAFGTGVPAEVQDLLKLDAGGLNWQRQIDQHLWFHAGSTHLIGEINRLVDMSAADTAVSRLSSRLRDAKARANQLNIDLAGAKAEYEKYSYAPQMATDWQVVTGAKAQAELLAGDAQWAKDRLAAATAAQDRLATIGRQGRAAVAVQQLGTAAMGARAAAGWVDASRMACRSYRALLEQPEPPDTTMLADMLATYNTFTQEARRVVAAVARANALFAKLRAADVALQADERQLSTYKRCPTCGSLKNE